MTGRPKESDTSSMTKIQYHRKDLFNCLFITYQYPRGILLIPLSALVIHGIILLPSQFSITPNTCSIWEVISHHWWNLLLAGWLMRQTRSMITKVCGPSVVVHDHWPIAKTGFKVLKSIWNIKVAPLKFIFRFQKVLKFSKIQKKTPFFEKMHSKRTKIKNKIMMPQINMKLKSDTP